MSCVATEIQQQLALFEGAGVGAVDLMRLREARAAVLQATERAENTMKMYEFDWRQFMRWCASAGKEPLPALADTVALYLTWVLIERKRKVATAEQHLAAITYFHRVHGYATPVNEEVRRFLCGVRRLRCEQPVRKRAVDTADLPKIARGCNASTAMGKRDRAIFILGFASTLRRSNLAALQLADVAFEERGLVICVRRSKTDQLGRGRLIGVWRGRRAVTDPVRVLREWIHVRGDWDGPLFCKVRENRIYRDGITGETIADIVQRAVERVGLDPNLYGAHSLRAGGITAAAEIGRSDREIMGLSGHESADMLQVYIRRARIFSGRNPLHGVL